MSDPSTWEVFNERLGELQSLYATGMRGSLFTGFLTMCSFLMAAKTFLVTNLKQEVYTKDEYLRFHVKTEEHATTGPAQSINDPLRRLADQLFLNVLLSLAACVCQFTFGMIPHWGGAVVALLVAVAAICTLAVTVMKIRKNLRTMFVWMDAVAADKMDGIRKAMKAEAQKKAEETASIQQPPYRHLPTVASDRPTALPRPAR